MQTPLLYQTREQKPAFTLIELVLVMGILVIVLGLSMSSLLQSQSVQIFNNNFSKLYSMVNMARSLSIAGKGQLDYTDFDRDTKNHLSSPPDYVTPANYGVRFDTASGSVNVRLFADINPPLSGALGQVGIYNDGTNYPLGHDLVLDSYSFPPKTVLKIIDGNNNTPSSGSFFFNMKYADISFENILTANSPFVRLQLTDQTTSACRQIRIHQLAGVPEVGPCT